MKRAASTRAPAAAAAAASAPRRRRRKADDSGAGNAPASAAQPDAQPVTRCPWVGKYTGAGSAEYARYHDEEWGRPVHDDRQLFELLVLEGAQAGLSWSTILAKRPAYRAAFLDFDPAVVAAFDQARLESLMAEGSGVVRHRGKLQAAVQNARAVLRIQQEHGSLDSFVWGFVPGGRPIVNAWTSLDQVPSRTAESEALSAALKREGMSFVGPTTMYAFMQAAGLVNDHHLGCPCRQEIIDGGHKL